MHAGPGGYAPTVGRVSCPCTKVVSMIPLVLLLGIILFRIIIIHMEGHVVMPLEMHAITRHLPSSIIRAPWVCMGKEVASSVAPLNL